jgi:transposase
MDAPPTLDSEPDPAEDARTIDRKGARSPRIEVITRGERRRVWTLEQKREIVAESLGSTRTPTEVARKYGISSGLLYGWRQKLLGSQMTLLQHSPPNFAQVELAPTQSDKADPEPLTPPLPPIPDPASRPVGLIEIVLASGVTLRVDATVDAAALGRVLGALDRR